MTPVRTALLGLAFAAPLLALPAAAQQTPGVSFVQPLSPAAVTQLQERLRQAGDYTGNADGAWNADSQSALERFQQRSGLQATGQVNQVTAMMLGINPAELLTAAAPPGTAPGAGPAIGAQPITSGPISALAVQKIQSRLRAYGFYVGYVDGIWGPGTQTALERFQQSRGLQPIGQLTAATLVAIGLDPANP
ncbi:MAG TPA: peptidoglycan-binding domain-containing protein [Roseomonas sp.]|jgi:peptidoglycan hydrolase-like protein with peptidoglycan-binding domain